MMTNDARGHPPSERYPSRRGIGWAAMTAVAVWLAGCATPPAPPVKTEAPPAPVAAPAAAPVAVPAPPPEVAPPEKVSWAETERDYRRDGAQHLYERYSERIFRGKLPPLLQAVGVMRLDIGPRGELRHFEWMRAPDHVPHVKAEIERLVRAAAPYPAPQRLGGVRYVDTWLWDKSGTFQLDTLTEGQLDRLPAPAARAPKAARATTEPTPRKGTRTAAPRGDTKPAAAGTATRVARGDDADTTEPTR